MGLTDYAACPKCGGTGKICGECGLASGHTHRRYTFMRGRPLEQQPETVPCDRCNRTGLVRRNELTEDEQRFAEDPCTLP